MQTQNVKLCFGKFAWFFWGGLIIYWAFPCSKEYIDSLTSSQLPSPRIKRQTNRMCVCSAAQSCLTLQPPELQPTRLPFPWDSPGKNTGVGCHFLLQGIFLTQGSSPPLLHWQADSLLLRYLGSPNKLTRSISDMMVSRPEPRCPWHIGPSISSPYGDSEGERARGQQEGEAQSSEPGSRMGWSGVWITMVTSIEKSDLHCSLHLLPSPRSLPSH